MRFVTSMIAPAALLLALASGCRGKLATHDDIPLYPGAVQVDRGHSSTAEGLINAYERIASRRSEMDVLYRFYALPASANASEVRSFYSDRMISAGWKWEDRFASEQEIGPYMANAMAWTREGAFSAQGVEVLYFFDARHGSSFMGVTLVSKK